MKKKLLVSLLAVVLIVVGAVGGVYAVGKHQPAQGNKLIGIGGFGIGNAGPSITRQWNTGCSITNPDCVDGIALTKVSIIRDTDNPNIAPEIVYEGPLISVWVDAGITKRTVITRLINPHECFAIMLSQYMYTGLGSNPNDPTEDADWMNPSAASSLPMAVYTIEVEWASKGKGELIGQRSTSFTDTHTSGPLAGNTFVYMWGTQMESLGKKGN